MKILLRWIFVSIIINTIRLGKVGLLITLLLMILLVVLGVFPELVFEVPEEFYYPPVLKS